MRITRQSGVMMIDQSEYYVDGLLAQFGITKAKRVSTPAQFGLHLSKNMGPDNPRDKREMKVIP